MSDHVDIMNQTEAHELARLLRDRGAHGATACDLAGGSWSVMLPTGTATELHAVALPVIYADDIDGCAWCEDASVPCTVECDRAERESVRVLVLPMDEEGELDNVETTELVCATLDAGADALAGMLVVWLRLVSNGAVIGIPRE